ncbi:MAG: MBL fold metallo-hydrolase, partial [Gammaproteobacteria bacterium]|nr:MBL fold metallo-hydrolase [Gammaproteobacteria bacterium]
PGVRWLRMPLPFALNHINLWLLRDRDEDGRDGWAVVDCGITDEATRSAWTQVFADELQGLPVLRVIVTHMHPDHIGLAHWLTGHWDCRLWISATDWHAAWMASQSTTGVGGNSAADFFASHGLVDPEAQDKIRARARYYPTMVPAVPAQFCRLVDGQQLSIGAHSWRCIVGYGHAPEHMSLYMGALPMLIAGDMLLPRISTNVSVFASEPEANPLPMYLASIRKLAGLPADTLVLPSHGKPFLGLHARIRQLEAHHDERLAATLQACRARPCSAADLLAVLFSRKLDLHQTTFAMGESIAHLHMLWRAGQLRRSHDADGVLRFIAA